MAVDLFQKTTIREILSAFTIFIKDSSGRPSDDPRWSPKLIYYHLVAQRAELYYQTRKVNQMEGDFEDYSRVIPCVEMKKVDVVECACAPPSGCYWMKSVYPMPTFQNGVPTAVTNLTGGQRYDYVAWDKCKYESHGRIKSLRKQLIYTMQTVGTNRHLYTLITSKIQAKKVKVSGIAVDPIEFFLFPVCGSEPDCLCDLLDMEFEIEARLKKTLFQMTYESLINANQRNPNADKQNNDSADTADGGQSTGRGQTRRRR